VRETSTLIAIQNLQADLYAGFTAARDMSSHGNGYGDVDIRNAITRAELTGLATRCRAAASCGARICHGTRQSLTSIVVAFGR